MDTKGCGFINSGHSLNRNVVKLVIVANTDLRTLEPAHSAVHVLLMMGNFMALTFPSYGPLSFNRSWVGLI